MQHGDPTLAQEVVLKLVEDIYEKGHVISMDNYFSSILLFKELFLRGIYTTGTVRINCIGLPTTLV